MTDEQILKRLAEIEFPEWEWGPEGVRYSEAFNVVYHYQDDDFSPWNPLTSWEDVGPLIEKYEVMLWPCDMGWCAECNGVGADHESLPWAICLAIIEANGGMRDE